VQIFGAALILGAVGLAGSCRAARADVVGAPCDP
jgi:hypothetical protein